MTKAEQARIVAWRQPPGEKLENSLAVHFPLNIGLQHRKLVEVG